MATVAQIKADLTKKVGVAMEMVKQEVCRIFLEVVEQYYGEYSPVMYERTHQIKAAIQNMANAVVKVRQIGASFEVYVDASQLYYIWGNWDENMVLVNVMSVGNHGGASSGGTPIWTESMRRIDPKMKSLIRDKLIAAGIPIH